MDESVQHLGDTSALGVGPRYSASAALFAYGVSRLVLLAVWTFGATAADSPALILRAGTYLFTASIGIASIALALKIV